MTRRNFVHVLAPALMIVAAGCRPQAQAWPSEPADLIGQVADVRVVRGLPGFEVRQSGATSGGGEMRLLRIRVIGARNSAPGTDADIGVDGITQVIRADSRLAADGSPELNGAFVRIWLRGIPRKASVTETIGMARVVAVDSVVRRDASR